MRFFRFSPSRLAAGYVVLCVVVLALFAVPLWYAWRVNYSTFKLYVEAGAQQELLDAFQTQGPQGLAAAIQSRLAAPNGDEILFLAGPNRSRVAGNVQAWPAGMPDMPGTSGVIVDLGGRSVRIVASHLELPGGYHLIMGRESARFQSLVDLFWYGIAGATLIALILAAAVAWLIRRALLAEVRQISRTASAIVEGDLSRRVPDQTGAGELDTLARTVNGMLEQLASQNDALHRAQESAESLVAERTVQLAESNESLRRSDAVLRRSQQMLAGEKRLLEMLATGRPLSEFLNAFCRFVEDAAPGCHCSIILADPGIKRVQNGAAPSLPPTFVQKMEGRALLRDAGPCALAILVKEQVISADIASDPAWASDWRALALEHGLRACWSTPILSHEGKALGAFALYFGQPGRPTAEQLSLIEQFAHLARVAIEGARTDDALNELRAELAHVARVATLGELTASIAHEVNQPLAGIMNNASACLRLLGADPPNLELAADTARRTLRDGNRAAEVISRLRDLFGKRKTGKEPVQINDAIREVIALTRHEVQKSRVVVETQLADELPPLMGDRVQLQQVVLNLMLNAAEAMSAVADRPRRLLVATERDGDASLRVAVRDCGAGLDPEVGDRIFDAFYTSKKGGMGMGLSIARSIVESHGGRLSATANEGAGATFTFTLPLRDVAAVPPIVERRGEDLTPPSSRPTPSQA